MKTGRFTTFLYVLIALSGSFTPAVGQIISPYLFGQNAWMPYGYGNVTFYGKLNQLWPAVKASHVQLVRIGGNAIEKSRPGQTEYISLIDSIRAIGAEPIVQVAYGNGRYTATQAASLVDYINTTMGRNVRYWSIGNEPNLDSSALPKIPVAEVAAYIKAFASAMKAKDPTILTVGPDCAWYDNAYYPALIGGANDITGQDVQGRFYIDIVSFHTYPFDGTQTRSQVIDWPVTSLTSNVTDLISRLGTANSLHNRTANQSLKWALTEFNVNYKNPDINTIEGVGVHSFLNGQFWGQVVGIGMQKGAFSVMPWSVHESDGNRLAGDLSYLDGSAGAIRRSSYYHLQLLAEYAKGSYIASTTNQSLVKSVATRDDNTIMVAVFNMDQMQSYSAVIGLNNTTSASGNLTVQVNANVNRSLFDQIESQQTVVYQFSTQGTLLKKCRYSLSDYQSGNGPTCSIPGEASCETAHTGSWTDSSTWLCGRVPGFGEEVIINAGHIVTVTTVQVMARKVTNRGGKIRFDSGGHLKLQPN